MKLWPALIALCAFASPLAAEVTPHPGDGDPHIQVVAYDGEEVVALHVASGYAVTVQFSPEERIETVTVGDSGAWAVQVNKSADRMVVKPLGFAGPSNLTVFTDARSYNFTLYAASAGLGVQPYLVRFTYPAGVAPEPAATIPVRGTYKLRGDSALFPQEISDNGTATTIRWPADVTLPAVYREESKHHIALVNGVVKNGASVIEGAYHRLIFVRGHDRAEATRIEAQEP